MISDVRKHFPTRLTPMIECSSSIIGANGAGKSSYVTKLCDVVAICYTCDVLLCSMGLKLLGL